MMDFCLNCYRHAGSPTSKWDLLTKGLLLPLRVISRFRYLFFLPCSFVCVLNTSYQRKCWLKFNRNSSFISEKNIQRIHNNLRWFMMLSRTGIKIKWIWWEILRNCRAAIGVSGLVRRVWLKKTRRDWKILTSCWQEATNFIRRS